MSFLPKFSSLKEALRDWEDPDVALYMVGRCLGLIEHGVSFAASKPLVNTSNSVSLVIGETLDAMVRLGAVEYDENEMRYRWNSTFKLDEHQIIEYDAS